MKAFLELMDLKCILVKLALRIVKLVINLDCVLVVKIHFLLFLRVLDVIVLMGIIRVFLEMIIRAWLVERIVNCALLGLRVLRARF
jgi:hypothetical protein